MSFCTQCGYPIEHGDSFCVNCGHAAERPEGGADTAAVPQWEPHTILEMKQWYAECRLPAYSATHMFVGENVLTPSSLGVCWDGTAYLTYQNDPVGNRRVRVRGTEQEAVAEFFRKFKPAAEKYLLRRAGR